MPVRALVLVAALAVCGGAEAAQLTVGPYVQDVTRDGFAVVYETDAAVKSAVVVDGQRAETEGTRHVARVKGLAAGRRYRYQVLVDGQPAAQAETATAPNAGAAFTFVVYGDTRSGGDVERALVDAMVAEGPDFALHTGDLVPKGSIDAAWPAFFHNEAALLARAPVYPTVGNHELWDDPTGEGEKRWFVLPNDGAARRYYRFDWGSARFFVLDGNGRFEEQNAWLDEELPRARREGVRHLFVLVHQGPLSTGGHCGAGLVERGWVERFERFGVRAVFAGHDHCYERLERGGVRYFVSGGGGAPLYEENQECSPADRAARRLFAVENHYIRVRVRGDEVEVAALRPVAGAPPIDLVSIRGDEPPAVAMAPSLDGASATMVGGWRGALRRWPLATAGGALVLLLFARGLLRRRRVR